MDNCKNCNNELAGKFCQNCGSPKEVERINGHYIVKEVSSVLNFEKGFFHTIKEIFLRPGATIENFIDGDRNRIVKPVIFLIICSLIYTIAQQFLNFEANLVQFNLEDEGNTPLMFKMYEWFSLNYGYANILMAIFIAVWIKIFFRRHHYNYFEIYILLCFIIGNSILISTLLGIIEGVLKIPVLQIGVFISLLYSSWAIGQFFDRKSKLSYLKGFLSYVFGVLTSILVFFIFGMGIELLLK